MTAMEFWELLSANLHQNLNKAIEIDSHKDSFIECPIAIQYVLSNIPSNEPLLRKQAAKIVHVYMKEVLGISDETNSEKRKVAMQLKDIYDCKSCVEDIVQVYSRGIMDVAYDISELEIKVFGGNEEITKKETVNICERINKMYVYFLTK